jgi:SAM-dependent methyltransferase
MIKNGRADRQKVGMVCRFCSNPLFDTFVDLGMSPLCETLIPPSGLIGAEVFYPLHVYVCEKCFLVQLDEFVAPSEIFSDAYPYYSSYSDSWVAHAKKYCDEMIEELDLNQDNCVMEIASNDGYLLQHFVRQGIPALGIEPAANVAAAADEKGVRTERCFFGETEAVRLSGCYEKPDLIIGNNVLAHVPNIVDFVKGMKVLLKETGIITMEFPHLMNLLEKNQFDTIYHEHFSYLSFSVVHKIFLSLGLTLFKVVELETHGGSIRIFARHSSNEVIRIDESVAQMFDKEEQYGLNSLDVYRDYSEKVEETKRQILQFLIKQKQRGKSIVGYGAPGKGNTLLNYCGIRTDFIDYTVDRNPNKHGTYTPGTRIPIMHPDTIRETKPDFLFVLPWNLIDEIIEQTSFIREWGGRWVVPIPSVKEITCDANRTPSRAIHRIATIAQQAHELKQEFR